MQESILKAMSTTVRVTQETHNLLKELSHSASISMQSLIEKALQCYRREIQRQQEHEQIAAFASSASGSSWDLDEELEQAAAEEMSRLS